MNLFRKILGLGPKEPTNFRPRKKPTPVKVIDEVNPTLQYENILPALVFVKTKEFDLADELVATFHERENNYADVVVAYVMINEKNPLGDDEYQLHHIKTGNNDEDFYHMLQENGERNLDDFNIPFTFWNPTDEDLDYKVLSCGVSFFASEKVMSKKHMLEAHTMLDSDELLVSIPRKGLIFVCDKNITEEHYAHFLNMHASIVLQENDELEFLCEDIFIVKNGEIDSVLHVHQLSEHLNA